ncbi:SAF domain-containing protein [Longispora albida]|uniref:SAF domain-containing protein n=1 Tax=Longispora albida TaxID=203523 RepID=UPI00035D6E5E|nr:SAF domain-containing protein [Longispora albida]
MAAQPAQKTATAADKTRIPGVASAGATRRISMPRILLGAGLVLVCVLASVVASKALDTRVPVLAAARPLGVGQTVTDADVKVVKLAASSEVATLPAAQRASVVGQTVSVPVAAGALLAPGQLGAAAWPPAGQSVVALPVKPGRIPSGLAAGAKVSVFVVPAGGPGGQGGAAGVVAADGTVTEVHAAADQTGTTVVSVLVGVNDAPRIASASGEVSVVQLGAGR